VRGQNHRLLAAYCSMFTGLVEGIGEIAAIQRLPQGLRLALVPPFPVAELSLGESVSVSGACLTVVAVEAKTFQVEVSPETLARTREGPDFFTLAVDFPDRLAPFIIEKGSIAVDGVSLTVNKVQGGRFSVYIIPHTAQKTTLGGLKVGSQVNLETDIIGKYVARLLGPYRGGTSDLSEEFLAEHGFL